MSLGRSTVLEMTSASHRGVGGSAPQRGGGPVVVPAAAVAGQNADVDLTEHLDAACSADHLFSLVEDLEGYPAWLTIVPTAVAADAGVVDDDPTDGDAGPAWSVELRGRIGPLARSKRLRMVRTEHEPPRRVCFERHERDGRDHAPWVLEAEVEPTEAGSRVTMHLHYGGGFGGAVLERMLRDEIERSRPRLQALADQGLPGPSSTDR